MTQSRFFKIASYYVNGVRIDLNKYDRIGRYSGNTPIQAAFKTFTKLCRLYYKLHEIVINNIKFIIQECTQNSKKRFYVYEGFRHELHQTKFIKVKTGKIIKYKYYNHIKKLPKFEYPDNVFNCCNDMLFYKTTN